MLKFLSFVINIYNIISFLYYLEMKRFIMHTMGCKSNQFESTIIKENLLKNGYKEDSLYIVIPAYNEEENIKQVVDEWYPIVVMAG